MPTKITDVLAGNVRGGTAGKVRAFLNNAPKDILYRLPEIGKELGFDGSFGQGFLFRTLTEYHAKGDYGCARWWGHPNAIKALKKRLESAKTKSSAAVSAVSKEKNAN